MEIIEMDKWETLREYLQGCKKHIERADYPEVAKIFAGIILDRTLESMDELDEMELTDCNIPEVVDRRNLKEEE